MTQDWLNEEINHKLEEVAGLADLRGIILDPPCKNCLHWCPYAKTARGNCRPTIILCDLDPSDWYPDFSCFETRRRPGEPMNIIIEKAVRPE